jgi:hypothetical protein
MRLQISSFSSGLYEIIYGNKEAFCSCRRINIYISLMFLGAGCFFKKEGNKPLKEIKKKFIRMATAFLAYTIYGEKSPIIKKSP